MLKIHKKKCLLAGIAAFAIAIPVTAQAIKINQEIINTSAASGDYGIEYNGGSNLELGSNVISDNEVVNSDSFLPLTRAPQNSVTTSHSSSSKWKTGYIKDDGVCRKVHYIKVTSSSGIAESDGINFTISNKDYETRVAVKNVNVIKNSSSSASDGNYMIGITEDSGYLYSGWRVFPSTTECNKTENQESNTNHLFAKYNDRIFVKMNAQVYKKGQSTSVKPNDLYFGITDIDVAQSYEIINSDSILDGGSTGNLFAKTNAELQPTTSNTTSESNLNLKNKYVSASGDNKPYIYSQFTTSGASDAANIFNINNHKNDIYAKLGTSVQTNGLDFVFGYANQAASGIEFYTQLYKVTYTTDGNGVIAEGARSDEDVISGDHPSGSTSTPNQGYKFDNCWKADVDVTLSGSNTPITAGTCLTPTQVTQVVVTEPITFTAIHIADTPVTTYTVTTEYLDENGENIIAPVVDPTNYTTGQQYTTEEKTFPGYTFVNNEGGDKPSGVIANKDINVIYNYVKDETPDIYTVTYVADEGGSITGIEKEEVTDGGNPQGSEATPDKDYAFQCWTADQNVTLTDEAEIASGDCITDEQIKQVIVDDDIEFTAHFVPVEVTISAPDTGSSTNTGGPAQAITTSLFVILGGILTISVLPQVFHRKKVKFTKH